MNVELIRARAGGLVRRGWRATVVLAVLAGLAAGMAMAVIGAGRRTGTAFDRFAAYADVPELLLNFCPPGVELTEPDAVFACYTYDAAEEQQLLETLPEVETAARGSFRGMTIAPVDDPSATTIASGLAMIDPGIPPNTAGRYRMIDGVDAKAADELVVNEELADRAGLEVGDRVIVTFWSADEMGTFAEGVELSGPTVEAEVTGVGRSLADLAASQIGFLADEASVAAIPSAMARATDEAGGFTGVLVEATDDDGRAAQAAIETAFEQPVNIAPALGADEVEPIRDAIQYEASATIAVGAVIALLVATFIVQAAARQSRREWHDGPVLRAVGMTTGEAAASALVRGAAVALPAAIVAVATAVLLSPFGPVGVGRRAEVDPGVAVDGPVLVAGALLVLITVSLGVTAPLWRGRALRPAVAAVPSSTVRRSFGLPPVASAGVHLARARRGAGVDLMTALASAAAAVIVIVAAVGLTASFDDLADTPARFGATWDLSVGADFEAGTAPFEEAVAKAGLGDQIDQASVLTGTDLSIGEDEEVSWVHAFVPLDDLAPEGLPLPIDRGRPPNSDREIALGALTMADAGVQIGDTVEVRNVASGQSFDLRVVGTAMINDTFEASPGRGGVVTPGFIEEAAPEIPQGDPIVLSLTPDADPGAFADQLRDELEAPVNEPLQQIAVRNVGRIRYMPYVMAAVVALLALASLVHALVLAVGRHRRVLGMLKGLGFTRRQVGATVAWHASTYAVVVLVVALPLGIIVGRWGWRLVAESLGVPAVPIVPLIAPLLVVVGLLGLANAAAVYPAWRAARLSTAAALHAE